MATIRFSEWVALREQMAGAPAVDNEIKQVVAANAGKPKQARQSAMLALVKKKQGDPKVKPGDLQKIADSFPEDDSK